MTNLTPPSASADDEQLRKKVIGSLSRAQVQDVDVMGEATIEREADRIMRLVALHTKEAERRARIDELQRLNFQEASGFISGGKHIVRQQVVAKRIAELAAAEQKRGGE